MKPIFVLFVHIENINIMAQIKVITGLQGSGKTYKLLNDIEPKTRYLLVDSSGVHIYGVGFKDRLPLRVFDTLRDNLNNESNLRVVFDIIRGNANNERILRSITGQSISSIQNELLYDCPNLGMSTANAFRTACVLISMADSGFEFYGNKWGCSNFEAILIDEFASGLHHVNTLELLELLYKNATMINVPIILNTVNQTALDSFDSVKKQGVYCNGTYCEIIHIRRQ